MMQRKRDKTKEKGQSTLLVVLALGLCLIAGMGFTMDISQLYSQRQLAQNAADSAALAAIMSLFDDTATGANSFGVVPNGGGNPPRLNCASNDTHTPCFYARQNGFDPSKGDTVYVDFWSQATAFKQEPGVSISNASQDAVPLLRVTVMRSVPATIMRLVGGGNTKIAAQATAAITTSIAPIPILILHPTLANSLNLSGTGNGNKIRICGGPTRSIQVNSCAGTGGSVGVPAGGSASCQSGSSFTWNGNPTVDLSHAGPLDTGDCSTGTGADFGNFGLPKTLPAGTVPVSFGTVGTYIEPASVLADPLLNVAAPTTTGLSNQDSSMCTEAKGISTCTDGGGNAVTCPSADAFGAAVTSCNVLKPGIYTSAGPLGDLKNNFYIFTPGVYYIQSGGLNFDANSSAQTQNTPPSGPAAYPTCSHADAATGCGALFFFAAPGTGKGAGSNNLSVNANSGDIALLGSDPTLAYQKILLFADHTSTVAQTFSLGGGGQWNVNGTIYLTSTINNTLNSTGQSVYQTLSLGGNSGSGTVTGEIIVDALNLGGTPNITMNLDPANKIIRQIALVR